MNKNLIVGIIVLLVVGGVAFYLLSAPAPVAGKLVYSQVNVTVYYSSECKSFCDTSVVETALKNRLLNVSFQRVDINSTEGKAKADEMGLTLVPAYVIDAKSLMANPRNVFVRQMVEQVGDSIFVVATLESYSGFMFRLPPTKNKSIDLFVSTYDLDSINLLNRTFQLFPEKGNVNTSIWYFPRGDSSEVEAQENFRQACIRANYTAQFKNYALCRARYLSGCDFNSGFLFCGFSWDECANPLGIDTRKVEACVNATSADIFHRDVVLKTKYNLFRYPSYVIGGQYVGVGVPTQVALKQQVCAVYPDIAECKA